MMRFTLTLAQDSDDGSNGATVSRSLSVAIDRDALAPETLGLTLAEAKAILTEIQAAIVADQIAGYETQARHCSGCGTARSMKGRRPLTCRTVFGIVQTQALRLRRCSCGEDLTAGDRASFSPVADLLPEQTTPELLYLETRWGSLVSYGLAARMLGDVLPLGKPVAPERVRRHLQAVARRDEAAIGEEAGRADCQRELDALPLPDGPAYVGVDGGFVRDRAGSWFEVIAGKSIPGFRRDAPEDDEQRPAKCFAFVQAHAADGSMVASDISRFGLAGIVEEIVLPILQRVTSRSISDCLRGGDPGLPRPQHRRRANGRNADIAFTK